MQARVGYGDRFLELAIDPARLVGTAGGPAALEPGELGPAIAAALAHPAGYPPLAQAVVPGDRVVIAVDPGTPELGRLIRGVVAAVREGGVEPGTITVLSTGPVAGGADALGLPSGVGLAAHDPDDRQALAYLASTETDRRIDLDRRATDADVVIPIGVIGFDRGLGLGGPWSVVYPGLSDRAAHEALRAELPPTPKDAPADRAEPLDPRGARALAMEASWLLGSRFQVGVEVSAEGLAGVLAGETRAVAEAARGRVEAAWRLGVERPAEVVVAGIGVRWRPTTWADLARGLRAASDVTAPRGSIVALADLDGEPGPAVQFLSEQADPLEGPSLLRRRREEADTWIARRLAAVVSGHRVYLHAPRLDPELVESLGFIPMDRPESAQRIVGMAESCIVFSPAERYRARIVDAGEG